ncbi:MAG: DNRLRE domain-containing protein, partial [bacterium]|nr:DNRLRE domain-containing protein [bacterium]
YPTDDSYTMGSQPDNNFGYQEYAFVGSYDNLELYATFLFDLSSYSGVTINDASLQLYITHSGGTFPPNEPWIARFDGSWDENTITWNNQPGWDDWYFTASDPPMLDWWNIDVTTWTIAWVNGTHDNYGMFVGADSLGSADWFACRTKEYSDQNLHPKLVLDYTETSVESDSLGEIKAAFK